jgi:predicted nucleic acid-binding protein
MDKCILDTDIPSEYLKGHDSVAIGRAAQYAHEYRVFSFTSVTVYEIVYGLEVKGATAQLQKVSAWLRQNDEIAPVAGDYIAAASLRAKATATHLTRVADERGRESMREMPTNRQGESADLRAFMGIYS